MNNTETEFENVLNECLEEVLGGQPVGACLAGHPLESPHLRPLLETAAAGRSLCAISPAPDFRARARFEFNRALGETARTRSRTGFSWSWRLATVTPLVIGLLLIVAGGVVAASSVSLPDQPLYGVKLATEQLQLRFTTSPAAKTRLYALAADRRVSEIATMAREGKATMVAATAQKLADDLNMVAGLVSPETQRNLTLQNASAFGAAATSAQDTRSTEKASGVVPPMAAAVPSTAVAGNVTPGAAGPSPTPAQVVDIDPALLKFLQENALKNPADLQALVNSVPENVRPALQQAIALTTSYQQVIGGLAANSRANR